MSREETFLSRWSRRKIEAREPAQEPEAPVVPEDLREEPREHLPAEAEAPAEAAPGAEEPPQEGPEEVELPDVESLTADSDYSVFMRADVNPALRNKALRKLWRSDPVYANLDGLNDYDTDFRNPAVVGAAVRTVYDAVRGYARMNEEDAGAQGDGEATDDAAPEDAGGGAVASGLPEAEEKPQET